MSAPNRTRIKILAPALTILLSACAPIPNDAPVRQERVSDRYSREAVKSYEVFDVNIGEHAMMLVRLTSGEHFPMVCHKTGSGIQPIPQSVFAEPGAERWSIMCEPRVRNVAALMRLDLSIVDGALLMGDRRLKSSTKVPLLSSPLLSGVATRIP